jgi:hypothetical protein
MRTRSAQQVLLGLVAGICLIAPTARSGPGEPIKLTDRQRELVMEGVRKDLKDPDSAIRQHGGIQGRQG